MTRIVYTDLVSTAIDLTLDDLNHRVIASAVCTITLPDASNADTIGKEYAIKALVDNVIVDTTSSQTIDGDLTKTLLTNDCMVVFSDGSNWLIG